MKNHCKMVRDSAKIRNIRQPSGENKSKPSWRQPFFSGMRAQLAQPSRLRMWHTIPETQTHDGGRCYDIWIWEIAKSSNLVSKITSCFSWWRSMLCSTKSFVNCGLIFRLYTRNDYSKIGKHVAKPKEWEEGTEVFTKAASWDNGISCRHRWHEALLGWCARSQIPALRNLLSPKQAGIFRVEWNSTWPYTLWLFSSLHL